MKAKDLMIPLQDYLGSDNTLSEAAQMMKTARRGEGIMGVRALPVLDEKGGLVGIVSMGDVLKSVFPEYLSKLDLGEFTWDGMVEGLARKVGGRKVSEVMTRKVVTVKEGSSLMECVDHMIKNNVKRLPVMDKAGKVVGMLYERDVFFAITRAMLNENTGGAK